MKKPTDRIKLIKSGVLLVSTKGKKQIAGPIRLKAIGYRINGDKKTAMAQLTFLTRNFVRASQYFDMSATLPRNRNKIIDALADADYRWPIESKLPERIIQAVLATEPHQSFTMVGAPGWYGDVILTSLRQYGKASRFVLDPDAGAHVAKMVLGPGSLEDWQETVATIAKMSSRLRLVIAAAFAALLLRRLNMDSFALNLFGETSTGKTTALYVAASVSGLIGENGLPGWADTIAGLEQIAVGHRDGIVPLDDTADNGNSTLPIEKKAKSLAFMFARNRGRNLDKSYAKKINLSVKEFRVISLSTSEFALKAIAESAATTRIGGEEVRFIDVPATEPGGVGIFDYLKLAENDDPTEVGQRLVNELRRHAAENQGFALDKFMRRVTKNPGAAIEQAKSYMAQYEREIVSELVTGADRRIAEKFAVIYAGAALAIDFGILPWKRKKTYTAIHKCMTGAFATLREAAAPRKETSPSIAGVAAELKRELDQLHIVRVTKGTRCSGKQAQERQGADGFRIGNQILIKSKAWKAIHASNRSILVEQGILAKQRGDTVTIDRKISGVSGKPRYHVINEDKLQSILELRAG